VASVTAAWMDTNAEAVPALRHRFAAGELRSTPTYLLPLFHPAIFFTKLIYPAIFCSLRLENTVYADHIYMRMMR
jgi:hypothetical protein